MKPLSRLIALLLSLAISATLLLPAPVLAQQSTAIKPAAAATDYSAPLAAIEKAIDDKRKEFGIPGASLVIVKDDKVIYLKGLGVKNFEKNIPVTPDTRLLVKSLHSNAGSHERRRRQTLTRRLAEEVSSVFHASRRGSGGQNHLA